MKKYIKNIVLLVICIAAVGVLWEQSHIKIDQNFGNPVQKDAALKQEVEFPKTYKANVNETFSINADIVVPDDFDPNQICRATAEIQELDMNKWKKRFLKGDESYEEDPEGGTTREGGLALCEYYQSEELYLCLSEQESSYYKGMSYMQTHACLEYNINKGTEDILSKTADLENLSSTNAWDGLISELNTLGITANDYVVSYCYALDHQTLQREEQKMLKDGNLEPDEKKGNWSEEDNTYFYCLLQKDQGLPVFYPKEVIEYEEDPDFGAVRAYYGVSGLLSLEANYLFDIKDGKEPLTLAPFEKIAETITKKYEQAVLEFKITVTKCRLFQYPLRVGKGTYELVPVWVCTLQYEDSDSVMYLPIHAVTGEEMTEMG